MEREWKDAPRHDVARMKRTAMKMLSSSVRAEEVGWIGWVDFEGFGIGEWVERVDSSDCESWIERADFGSLIERAGSFGIGEWIERVEKTGFEDWTAWAGQTGSFDILNLIGRAGSSDIGDWVAQIGFESLTGRAGSSDTAWLLERIDSFDIEDWIEQIDFESLIEWADFENWIEKVGSSDTAEWIAQTDSSGTAEWIAQTDSSGTADWIQLSFFLSPFDPLPLVYFRSHSSLPSSLDPSVLASHPSPFHSLSASPPPQLQTVPPVSPHPDSPLYPYHCYCCSSQMDPRRSLRRSAKVESADSVELASKTARLDPYPRCAKRISAWIARREEGCMWV